MASRITRDYDAIPAELMKWVNAGGKKVPGLVNRRAAEAGLWAKGEFVASNTVEATKAVPVKDVAVIGGTGTTGVVATIGPAVPDIIDALSSQREELTSGQWVCVKFSHQGKTPMRTSVLLMLLTCVDGALLCLFRPSYIALRIARFFILRCGRTFPHSSRLLLGD